MHTIHVNTSSHSYDIQIAENIRFDLSNYLTETYSSVLIITDQTVADLYLHDIKTALTTEHVFHEVIPVGESSKHIDQYYKLLTKALEYGLDRKALIIALGGGVVGDLAGFVAATYLRGIDFIQLPTTILAHDSSVGGKVGINHELGKNLIGSFYPPKSVIYDVTTLQTLAENEIRSGYAEILKEALIADEALFYRLLKINLDTLSPTQLKEHLYSGIKIKAAIVEADERESGVRMHLNLGHTLAHALEAELGYGAITHGEAVAIGLLFALQVSEEVYGVKLPIEALRHWLQVNEYPLYLKNVNIDNLLDKMKLDKKVVNKQVQMVLLKNVGEPIVTEVDDEKMHASLSLFIEKLVK